MAEKKLDGLCLYACVRRRSHQVKWLLLLLLLLPRDGEPSTVQHSPALIVNGDFVFLKLDGGKKSSG